MKTISCVQQILKEDKELMDEEDNQSKEEANELDKKNTVALVLSKCSQTTSTNTSGKTLKKTMERNERDTDKEKLMQCIVNVGTSVIVSHNRGQGIGYLDRTYDEVDLLEERKCLTKGIRGMKETLDAKSRLHKYLQQQCKNATSDPHEHTQLYEKSNSQLSQVPAEVTTLEPKYEKLNIVEERLHKKNTRLPECRVNLVHDLETDWGQIENLKWDIREKNDETTDLKSKLSQVDEKYHDLDKQKVDLSANVDMLQSTIKDMTMKINNRESTINYLQAQLQRKESELRHRGSKINILEENVNCKDLELQKKKLELQKVRNDVITLENKVRDETWENERLRERNSNLNNKKDELERECLNNKSELNIADRKMELMNRELKKLQKWKREYDDELERQRMRKKGRGDLVNMVVSDMSARLISLFEHNKSGLEFEEVDSVSRIKPNTPVLVFCINASKPETDVSNALTGIRVNPQVAIVVLHHKQKHALPNISSKGVLTSKEYKSIGEIFDMACLSSKGGLYDCEMNTSAIRGLFEFIKQRNTQ